MRISDWSSDVCSSDLRRSRPTRRRAQMLCRRAAHSDPADGGDGGLCRGDDRAAAQRDVGEPRSRGPARRPRSAANAPPLRALLVLLNGNDVWIYATPHYKPLPEVDITPGQAEKTQT